MKKRISGIFFAAVLLLVLSIVFISVFIYGIKFEKLEIIVSLLIVLGAALICAILKKYVKAFTINKNSIWILLIIYMFVKSTFVFLLKTKLNIDSIAYWQFSEEILTTGKVEQGRYVAMFSHLMGYVSFISLCRRVFGATTLFFGIANVFFSGFTMLLMYRLVKKLSGINAAFAAAVLWTVCPSQSLWNSCIISEVYYTMLLILAINMLYDLMYLELSKVSVAFEIVGISIVLRLLNMTRPIVIIFFLACLFYVLFIELSKKRVLIYLAVVLTMYIASSFISSAYIEYMVGEKTSGMPWYSIAVGFNESYSGVWNQEDWDLLLGNYASAPGATAVSAQESMKSVAIDHIRNIEHPLRFASNKLYNFMGCDCTNVCVYINRYDLWIGYICDVFYYIVLIITVFFLSGEVFIKTSKTHSFIYVCILFYLGLWAACMLTEVSTRYHYPLLMFNIIFAAVYIGRNRKNKKNEYFLLRKECVINSL